MIGRILNRETFENIAPKAGPISTLHDKGYRARELMKSSKGKVPQGGKTKRVAAAGHASKKHKEKDPVEVRITIRFRYGDRLVHGRCCNPAANISVLRGERR